MRYSIIVALDNNFALTNNFVENLLLTESLQNDSELVIVSDGCANIQTIDYLKKLSEKSFPIKIIYNKTKLGYGKSNNIGVEHSQGDILVFLNSDVFPVFIILCLTWKKTEQLLVRYRGCLFIHRLIKCRVLDICF